MGISNANDGVVLDVMARHLEAATIEMFADYELLIHAADGDTVSNKVAGDTEHYAAIIGYVGKGIRGALILLTESSTIRAWLKHLGSEDTDVADALGEFANMALGRLKTSMIPEGVLLQLSTPTIASGRNLVLSGPPNLSTWLNFDGPDWTLRTRLDLELDPGFELKPVESEATPAEAGDAFLF
jgi:CheY-specific phosphatase CheX